MHIGEQHYEQLKHRWKHKLRHQSKRRIQRHSSQPASNIAITSTQDVMNKQLNVENLPRPEIHRSIRTQGIMAGEWRGQNLRKTVGECEIEVGRHKHMHEMRQCSSVLLVGDGCYGPSVVSPFTRAGLLVCLPQLILLRRSPSYVSLRVAGGQLCLVRSLVDGSL